MKVGNKATLNQTARRRFAHVVSAGALENLTIHKIARERVYLMTPSEGLLVVDDVDIESWS